jgi:hypothetical protein
MKKLNVSQESLENAIKTGYVFVRCIPLTGLSYLRNETAMDVEIRKILRVKGMPSLTKQSAKTHGYPCASTSLIGQKTAIFGSVGYGVINPSSKDIMSVSKENAGTGGHKKTRELTENLDNDLKNLKKFVGSGGNAILNNEIEINIHEKTPISFVFANPGKEIYAVYFKEKFKNYMGLELPVFSYANTNYPKAYTHAKNDIIQAVRYKKNELDFIITMFDYYKEDALAINSLKSSINDKQMKSYLNGNMHASNFSNAIKLADKLGIEMDSDFRERVGGFLIQLDKYSTFDIQNKKLKDVCFNKRPDEVIELLRNGWDGLKMNHEAKGNRRGSLGSYLPAPNPCASPKLFLG